MSTKKEHWADITADKIIRNKGEKEQYTCASGITPSGTVHIGNFREIISVDLVVRALRDQGKNVRFIYSWDDYDVFRKIPINMPQQEMLTQYLRKPITATPDPYGKEDSYARHNEVEVEAVLPEVGIFPEYIYQTGQYQGSVYAEGMKKALECRQVIMDILNEHRKTPLADDWYPVSVFCENCLKDETKFLGWDGDYTISYSCDACGHKADVSLKEAKGAKLFWRIDWPMRWNHEQVDFEPAGKEHHSSGGSFDTAKVIAKQVYNYDAPETFKYDFISIKGQGGKISSSKGNVISLKEALEIYQPPIVRFLFAGTRPNTEFAISFDLDVIKIYEDYDRCERVYYDQETISEKKKGKQKRIYELSQVNKPAEKMPHQLPFRHLTNILMINSGDIDKFIDQLNLSSEEDKAYARQRAVCAWNWIEQYAPEDFRFHLRAEDAEPVVLEGKAKEAVLLFKEKMKDGFGDRDEKGIAEWIYEVAHEVEIDTKEFFVAFYNLLVGKDQGPRLAGFLHTIGYEKLMKILSPYK